MFAWVKGLIAFSLLFVTSTTLATGGAYGLGTPATPAQIAGWDIDIRPDGMGLPAGQGSAEQGEGVFQSRCASCHGEFGEASGRYPALMGGVDSLKSEDPVKTVGSYWPYASTVFDYVRRAMPFGHAQSLTSDETYAITAFILNLSEIVEYDQVLNAENLASIKMPNRDGFIKDDRPDVPSGEPCMSDCRGVVKVVGKARVIDVTPDKAKAAAEVVTPKPQAISRGEKVFAQCQACHSLKVDEHGVGPSLNGVVGRRFASAAGFDRYSPAMKSAGQVWSEQTLTEYLKAPQRFVPGTSMPFAGLSSEQDIRDLIQLLSATK